MTIIDFYKELSNLLKDAREDFISKGKAKKMLEDLIKRAKESKLEVNVDPLILDSHNLMRLDDENSYTPEDDFDDISYGDDSSYGYDD